MPGSVELRLRGAFGDAEHSRNLRVVVPLNVIQPEDGTVPPWQTGHGPLEGDPIDDRHAGRHLHVPRGLHLRRLLWPLFGAPPPLPAAPPDMVDRHLMQPCGELRIAAE